MGYEPNCNISPISGLWAQLQHKPIRWVMSPFGGSYEPNRRPCLTAEVLRFLLFMVCDYCIFLEENNKHCFKQILFLFVSHVFFVLHVENMIPGRKEKQWKVPYGCVSQPRVWGFAVLAWQYFLGRATMYMYKSWCFKKILYSLGFVSDGFFVPLLSEKVIQAIPLQ